MTVGGWEEHRGWQSTVGVGDCIFEIRDKYLGR